MMYLLNISFMAPQTLEDVLMTWLNNEFVPVVTDPAIGFDKFEAFKMISPKEKHNITICFQLRSTNRKKLETWFEEGATPVCNTLYKRFVDPEGNAQVVIFPSMMESIG